MANGTGNPDLERVLKIHKRRPKRFAVLRWVAHVEFYNTEDEARAAMAKVPVKRRVGIVDRETGETRTNKQLYHAVMSVLRKRNQAPERFRRIGALGKLRKPRRRRDL